MSTSAWAQDAPVPDLRELTLDSARAHAQDASPRFTLRVHGPKSGAIVVSQSPLSGATSLNGSILVVTVPRPVPAPPGNGRRTGSGGGGAASRVAVPDLVSLPVGYADRLTRAHGLELAVSEGGLDDPDRTIVSQEPNAGDSVSGGDTVRVTLAPPEFLVAVPDLMRLSRVDATSLLTVVGLGLRLPEGSPDEDTLVVAYQSPVPGELVEVGEAVLVALLPPGAVSVFPPVRPPWWRQPPWPWLLPLLGLLAALLTLVLVIAAAKELIDRWRPATPRSKPPRPPAPKVPDARAMMNLKPPAAGWKTVTEPTNAPIQATVGLRASTGDWRHEISSDFEPVTTPLDGAGAGSPRPQPLVAGGHPLVRQVARERSETPRPAHPDLVRAVVTELDRAIAALLGVGQQPSAPGAAVGPLTRIWIPEDPSDQGVRVDVPSPLASDESKAPGEPGEWRQTVRRRRKVWTNGSVTTSDTWVVETRMVPGSASASGEADVGSIEPGDTGTRDSGPGASPHAPERPPREWTS